MPLTTVSMIGVCKVRRFVKFIKFVKFFEKPRSGEVLADYEVAKIQKFASLQAAQIDLSRYANGVYFIKVVADGNVMGIRKVVKQ